MACMNNIEQKLKVVFGDVTLGVQSMTGKEFRCIFPMLQEEWNLFRWRERSGSTVSPVLPSGEPQQIMTVEINFPFAAECGFLQISFFPA